MSPPNRTIDSNDQVSTPILLGLALLGSVLTIGTYLLIGG